MILKQKEYDFFTTDLILISADLSSRSSGVRIHSTTKRYWDMLWYKYRDRFILGVIRKGLFINVEQLTKKSV